MNNRLLALCLGNVVIGTGTMVVQGMLPVLASGLDIGLHSAGRLIAAFAFTVCVFTPLLAAWLSRLDRRWLLSGALALFAVGHLASALATSYGWMLITRVVSALSAGLFTSQAAGATRLLVPPEKQGGAVAMVFLGWGIAGVVGMPLSAWLAEHYGWQSPLWLVAISAAIVAVWVAGVLPAKLHTPPIDRRAWWSLARDRAVVAIIALTAIHSTGQFVVFAYIAPILKLRTGASAEGVTLTLALFGVTGIVGNILAVRYMDRMGTDRVALFALLAMLAGHAVMAVAGFGPLAMMAALALWGLGCFSVNSAQQARLLHTAPMLASVSIALNSSAMYLGQALGAETGGHLVELEGFEWLPRVTLPIFALAVGVSAWASRGSERLGKSGRAASR
ncbi:MAG: MFS transporter [Betaproteobacteria bacterium]|nr:MFS transporter [Betaproteobacteria bacterium]